jgi:hypothetical protein
MAKTRIRNIGCEITNDLDRDDHRFPEAPFYLISNEAVILGG